MKCQKGKLNFVRKGSIYFARKASFYVVCSLGGHGHKCLFTSLCVSQIMENSFLFNLLKYFVQSLLCVLAMQASCGRTHFLQRCFRLFICLLFAFTSLKCGQFQYGWVALVLQTPHIPSFPSLPPQNWDGCGFSGFSGLFGVFGFHGGWYFDFQGSVEMFIRLVSSELSWNRFLAVVMR